MIEYFERNSRRFETEWVPAPFMPPRELTIQSSGICFTAGSDITLVSDGSGWLLPGGCPENGETLEQALVREIHEEACARVTDYRYIGCQKTVELPPVREDRLPLFYQARFWVRVENLEFDPRFEITQRIEIEPVRFIDMIRWPTKKIARLILDAALAVEVEKANLYP